MPSPQALTDWYQAGQNNGLLTSGGSAPNPVNAVPATGASSPLAPNVVTGSNTQNTVSANPAPVNNNVTTPSTYKGLLDSNVQLGDASKWNVTPDQTASGQLSGILASGSPLMQLAKSTGESSANQRGLLNSSISAGAAENAMIANATPIAEQNATTYSNAASANQSAENAFKTTNAANTFNAQQNAYNQNIATANQQSSQQSQQQQSLQSQIGGMNQQLNNDIATIQTNPNMNQQAKQYAIAQLQDAYKSQVTMLSAVGTVPDVSTLLHPVQGTENPQAPDANTVFGPQPAAQPKSGKVICTYYHSIGFMDNETFALDQKYGAMVLLTKPELSKWYLSWAINAVEILKNNPKLTCALWPIVNEWSKEMAYQMGGKNKGSLIGKSIMLMGNVCCSIIGALKPKEKTLCQQ